nr:MetaGeneMark_Unknown Function [uncultured bacterium]
MRMQEPDGGRREDGVKFWGHWNDDGFGSQYALVQYSGMGEEIKPADARPGDFVNISWTSGLGHSAIFLCYLTDETGAKRMLYWSSQPGTNGLGDQSSPLEKIKEVKFVRLTHPEKVFTFDPGKNVDRKVPGDKIEW